jgi:hypothetical protein
MQGKIKILSLLAAGTLLGAQCPPPPSALWKRAPDRELKKEGWVLRIWITAKGTRSEGRHGRLYHEGREICPAEGNATLATPLGRLRYRVSPMPWGWHGWQPVENERHVSPHFFPRSAP